MLWNILEEKKLDQFFSGLKIGGAAVVQKKEFLQTAMKL